MPGNSSHKYYDRLYEVKLERGLNNAEWPAFYDAVTSLNGKAPDYGGIVSLAIVSHHADSLSVFTMITTNIKHTDDVSIEEITRATLKKQHRSHCDLLRDYFLPYKRYRNIGTI